MLFAQFYNRSAINPADLIEACGGRAVVIYDARVRQETNLEDAKRECVKRGFAAYALFRGDTFTRSNRVTSIQRV